MIKIKFCTSLLILLICDVNSETPCTLPNSKALAVCMNVEKCSSWQLSTDFLFEDKINEHLERAASCKAAGPRMICCEKQQETLAAPSNSEIPPEKHKNFGLFDNSKCGDPHPLDRVANGEDAGLLQHPWAVRIGYITKLGDTSFNCGGSLITSRYVLTAAHCITGLKSTFRLHSVRLGEYDEKTNPDCEDEDDEDSCAQPYQDVIIESSTHYPNYDPRKLVNDIGLIRLRLPAKIAQDNIGTICLPFNQKGERITKNYEVIGWGATTNSTGFPILQKALLPEFNDKACETLIREKTKKFDLQITDSQICAGGENMVDSCRGDSGGPLLAPTKFPSKTKTRVVQYGIVSYGVATCGEESVPGVYTKVSKYLNWIMDNMH